MTVRLKPRERRAMTVRLYGVDYSIYVRIARMALLEKGVDHELVPVDVLSPDGVPGIASFTR